MQATKTAQIYATVIANPGITSREITKKLNGATNVARILVQLKSRGAIIALPGKGPRSAGYYKGTAPVVLRQAAGTRQRDLNAASAEAKKIAEMQGQLDWLQSELDELRANSKYKLGA